MITVDVPTRLRRAIVQNDVSLVKRILQSNPEHLQNPDFANKSETSLHLAARHGLLEVIEYLVSLGHDHSEPPGEFIYLYSTRNKGLSYNTDGQTPLHLAASHSHPSVVQFLCIHFPKTINKGDKTGSTPLHLGARAHPIPSALTSTPAAVISAEAPEDTSTVEALLAEGANVHAEDDAGDTSLHYATAWGNLKTVRVLMSGGADPLRRNKAGWTPEYYSITFQAEAYYRSLVAEWQQMKLEESIRMRERRGKGGAGVRLVQADESESEDAGFEDARDRADSGESRRTTSTLGGS